MRAPIKYPGSKWAIAEWIIGHFPEHHSYLEPFFGSGAVLFTKAPSDIETVNDLDGDVVNLFRWIRDDPERLASEINLIPYARGVYELAFERQYSEKDPFMRAVYFYVRMMMGHGFRTTGDTVGWKRDVQGRESAYALRHWNQVPWLIESAAARLKEVQIDNRPAVEVISKSNYPNVLIYADPPYVMETRYGAQYRHEMTAADHLNLLDALKAHSGPVLISGYETEMYMDQLRGWSCDRIQQRTQSGAVREECLWMNFKSQKTLFDFEQEE